MRNKFITLILLFLSIFYTKLSFGSGKIYGKSQTINKEYKKYETCRLKKVEIFSIGVEDANMDVLSQICSKPALKLNGLMFKELFIWLSSSLSAASRSRPGENVQLPSTDPWRDVGI